MAQRPRSTRAAVVVLLVALGPAHPRRASRARTRRPLRSCRSRRQVAYFNDWQLRSSIATRRRRHGAHPARTRPSRRFGWFSSRAPTRSSAPLIDGPTWTPNICGLMADGYMLARFLHVAANVDFVGERARANRNGESPQSRRPPNDRSGTQSLARVGQPSPPKRLRAANVRRSSRADAASGVSPFGRAARRARSGISGEARYHRVMVRAPALRVALAATAHGSRCCLGAQSRPREVMAERRSPGGRCRVEGSVERWSTGHRSIYDQLSDRTWADHSGSPAESRAARP